MSLATTVRTLELLAAGQRAAGELDRRRGELFACVHVDGPGSLHGGQEDPEDGSPPRLSSSGSKSHDHTRGGAAGDRT